MSRTRILPGGDSGSAAVEFALVAPLVLVLFAALVQIGMAGYVRTTLVAAAADGARAGATNGAVDGTAKRRAQAALADSLAAGVVADISEFRDRQSGVEMVSVTIRARLPLIGLLGPEVMTVSGRALAES
ncbi:MAG: pilus assembly protein [Candidatus Nanopelagicales bacterium]|nr:pilus assembly protein [Candidatus Nanopelagicales bacterium]